MHTETLQAFALHHETNEPIPEELVAQMRAADEFGKGLFARRQMVYAALSLNCYRKDPKTFEIHDLAVEMQNYYGQFPYELETQHECSFGHLDGYSAIYYTYMWSLVIAKDLLSKFEEGGMLNVDVARSYRIAILEPGGSADAAELVRSFLGRPYSFEAFAKWLSR
jgi:thimet oligopeptidase